VQLITIIGNKWSENDGCGLSRCLNILQLTELHNARVAFADLAIRTVKNRAG